MVDRSSLTRRTLLSGGLALGGGLALSSCRTENRPGGGEGGGGGAGSADDPRPAYIPYDGPQPDLEGDGATGVPNGFFSYPDPAPSTGRVPLGLSAPVHMMVQSPTVPSAHGHNKWWQMWEADLGTELKLDTVNSTEYTAKFQTAIAGNQLAEITQIVSVPQQPAMLEEMFTDLTPYLSGDNVSKYPNLASFPTASWDVGVNSGKLWGIPNPRIPAGSVLMTRGDILESKGLAVMPELSNGDDFLDMCRELTNRDEGIFAIGQNPRSWTLPVILESLGGPNGWKVEADGTWVNALETPEYEQALEIVTTMFSEGMFHPNTYTDLGSTAVWFDGGATALFAQNFSSWQTLAAQADYPCGVVVMPQWGGGGPAAKHLGVAAYGSSVGLAKTDDEARIDELLRVADYFASPFGSEEYLKIKYGVRGLHYEMTGGQVEITGEAPTDLPVGAHYYGAQNVVNLYAPGDDETTQLLFDYCQQQVPGGVGNPKRGKISETEVGKGSRIGRPLSDLGDAIIQGRDSLSKWPEAVKKWKADGGDQIARELAEQD